MLFILAALVSAACSVFLTKLVTLLSDDFVALLSEPNSSPSSRFFAEDGPSSEPQMTLIGLFVTAMFYVTFVQDHWLGLSFAAGLIGSAALLAFICGLALLIRGGQWAEYGIKKFYRQSLHSFGFVDKAYAAAKSRLR